MKRTLKKAISLFLALVCMLSCFSMGTVFARDGSITDHQAIVLVLDTSGSMYGKPVTNLKKAALEFCNKIIGADPKNQIAIVTFSDSSNVNNFTSNLTELARTIQDVSASGGTEMADAIQSADTLLQKDTLNEGYVKSIVTMADGEPWDDSETVQAATALFSKYNMYSIGFFEYENGGAKNLLKSIQNCGYYEANDVDALIDEFVKIATDILNPFTIKLSHGDPEKSENVQNPGSYTYKYKITAEIINGNSKQANNVKVSIDLGQSMTLSSGSNQTIEVGTLGAGETKTLAWNIEMPMVVLGVTMYDVYYVTASSDNTVNITSSDKIIIEDDDDYNKNNNELDFNRDVWSFGNFGGPLYMSKEDKGALLLNLKDNEKAYIDERIEKSRNYSDIQGGHCWGMSVTTVLSKMGIINPCLRQSGTNCLHDITMNPTDNSNIESLITFYQLTTSLDRIREEVDMYNEQSNLEKIQDLIAKSNNVKNGGSPFVIWFSYQKHNDDGSVNFNDKEAHAVVGYAYQQGTYSYYNRDYNGRILIYDSNPLYGESGDVFNDDICLYINTSTGDWTFPLYDLANSYSYGGELNLVTNSLELLSTKDYDTSTSNYEATLQANSKTHFILKNKNGTYDSDDIYKGRINGFLSYALPGGSSAPQIDMPNNLDYTIENVNKNDVLDYDLNHRGKSFLSAKATIADNVKFNYNGQVGLTNNKEDYLISSTVNNGPIQWYTISVSGNKTTNPTLRPTEQGFVFEGDNMDSITITDTNDAETKELTFTTTEDKVLISENDN